MTVAMSNLVTARYTAAGALALQAELWEGYQNLVLAQRPQMYLPLTETTGTTSFDISNHGNNGTLHGGITVGQPGPLAGDSDQAAMAFDGSTGYIQLPSLTSLVNPSFSLIVWFNISQGVLVGTQQASVGGANGSWNPVLWVGTNGILYGDALTQNTNYVLSNNVVLSPGWHCAVLTCANQATATLYLDGIQIQQITDNAFALTNLNNWQIGVTYGNSWQATNGSWFYADGAIGQVAFFTTALDPTTVRQLYLAGSNALHRIDQTGHVYTGGIAEGSYPATILADHPEAFYPLNDPATTAYDRSGHHLNGTVIGGVTSNVLGPLDQMGNVGMRFDGSSGYINVPIPMENGASLSIECWVRLHDFQGVIMALASSPHLESAAQTAMYCGNNGPSWIGGNTNYSLSNGLRVTPNPPLKTWLYCVFVYSSTFGSQFYLNGVGGGYDPVFGNTQDMLYLTLGAGNMSGWYGNLGTYLKGDLAQIAIYSYALSAAQVKAHYQASQGTYRQDFAGSRQIYTPSLIESASYTNTMLSLNPVAYLPLQTTLNGTTPDISGHHNTGTLAGGITPNAPGPFGTVGDVAMAFNGSTGYISIAAFELPISAPFSIIAWANYANLANSGEILSARQPDDFSFDIDLTSGGIHSDIGDGSSWLTTSANSNYSFQLNTWYFIAMTVTRTEWIQYVNGIAVGNASLTGGTPLLTNGTHLVKLGTFGEAVQFLGGSLAHVAILDYALSPSQVALLWNAGQGLFLDATIPV